MFKVFTKNQALVHG